MNKPNSYEEVKAGGEYTPVEIGGHHAIIKNVEEQTSQSGKPMIKVSIDFAQNDKQPGYFMDSFQNDIRPEKKWPFQATQYIVSEDNDGKCSKSFKGFITSFEHSNNCEAVWGANFCKQFKNKKIGVVFGNVEEEYNGNVSMRQRIRWFCDDANVETAKVPEDRLLTTRSSAPASSDEFMKIPEGAAEEIPF